MMSMRTEIPPDTLLGGKIRLIKRIGRGGMGDVWVARNEATQAELAVKTLHRSERTPVHDERFRREARLSATISHRNVVRVFDLVDEADGTLGLVMELLKGGTLEDCMKERGPLTSVQALSVILPVLSAMHHVHQKGIVHRDVKPANVFFAVEPDGHVIPKVLDFGIAKLPAAGSALTMDGSVLGTPHYMSPEQIRGQEDIDGRSDMFSLAVVLYEMLTGVRVFQRETASASLAAVLEHEVDPDPRIEPRLWIAISRALAKRPYERFTSCAELADTLRASVEVTDEDLAMTLQELRPQSASTSSTTSPSSIAISSSKNQPKLVVPRRWGMMVTAAIAIGTAILAVGLTLILTRSSSGGGNNANTTTTSNGSVAATNQANGGTDLPPSAATDSRLAIPPPPSSSSVAENNGNNGNTATPGTATMTPISRPTSATKRVAPPPPKGTATTPKPKGSVATTPGF
jgi:eukaryotic-like serine/threonine-protein kinase